MKHRDRRVPPRNVRAYTMASCRVCGGPFYNSTNPKRRQFYTCSTPCADTWQHNAAMRKAGGDHEEGEQ